MNLPDPILDAIARDHLCIPTLASRQADNLDFHDVAVWQLEAALKAAFDAGTRSAGKNAESQDLAPNASVEAASSTSLLVTKGTPLAPGKMYMRLYHGRNDPEQEMDDWGFVGPTFGPLSSYIHTYCSTFRIYGACDTSEVWLERHDDMIRWDGCFFGDFEVFIAGTNDKA
jgi:hypothetical protein